MSTRVSLVVMALALLGLVVGCSESPKNEMEASTALLDSARLAEVETYAPELYRAATDSLNAASVEIAKQEGRFTPFRDYDRAKEIISSANLLIEQGQTEAIAQKERVRVQDSILIAETTTMIEETNKLLASAPRGKGSQLDLKVMQSDVEAASTALAGATADYQAGRYQVANEKLTAVRTQVEKVKGDIQTAMTATKK